MAFPELGMEKKADKKKQSPQKASPRPPKGKAGSKPASPPDFKSLRWLATARLEDQDIPPQELSPAEAARLIHELRVYQIELEMQNEELRQSQVELEESRSKYADLYDFAPVGYLTLDPAGRILEANLTAATLLGVERGKLVRRFFPHFIEEADRWILRRFLENPPDKQEMQAEFHLNSKAERRAVLLNILCLRDAEGRERYRLAMTDITERQRSEEALRESEERLRFLTTQILTAQENERKRIAAELHDVLGHALVAMKLHLSSVEKKLLPEQGDLKEDIHSQIDYIGEVVRDIRRLYYDLSPGDVEDLGLTKALRMLINDFAGFLPEVVWHVDLADLKGLFSLPVQTIIYRVFQEALTNIAKHGHPTAVTISSKKERHRVHFVVQDNGAGFDVKELESGGAGRRIGLVAMKERLSMVGGSFTIQSRKQRGTRLNFTIPITPATSAEKKP
jgi:PAS domain S-box-containing protein